MLLAFVPGNNITLEMEGMTWEYQEQITGKEAVYFRTFIDMQEGNSNKFVNAWEILKAEIFLKNRISEAIKTKPDVKLNGTSEPVKVRDIDFQVSKEALGRVEKNSSISNSALVSYVFEKNISPGTDIWFMGTPNSTVTITLPAGFGVKKTDGLENKSQEFNNNCTVLKGNFSQEKNITLWISENGSSKAREQLTERTDAEQGVENRSKEEEDQTKAAERVMEIKKSSGFFKEILRGFA